MAKATRREFLQIAGVGGVVFASGLLKGCVGAGPTKTAANADDFYFVQLSDSHWGFEGPPNPDAKGTLKKAVAAVNALAEPPDFIVFTGDLTHITEDARERLARDLAAINAEFRRAASAKGAQPGKLYELDEKFHRRYVEAGSGPRLLSLHEAVKPQAERYIRMYIALLLDTVPTAGTEHDAIVDAIRTGNAAAAQRAAQTNWRHASDRLVKAIDVMGEQGNW